MDKLHQQDPVVAWVREQLDRLESRSHLDINCGDGSLCLTLAAEGLDCLGIDPDKGNIEKCRMAAEEKAIDVIYDIGTIKELPKLYFETVSLLDASKKDIKKIDRGMYVFVSGRKDLRKEILKHGEIRESNKLNGRFNFLYVRK